VPDKKLDGQQIFDLKFSLIDIETFCELILDITEQFQEANGSGGIFITEQGGWHALYSKLTSHRLPQEWLANYDSRSIAYISYTLSRVYK
jgi:hypothetical protein